jgi:uncharacterized protein YndB with AHSA1/START domain
MKAINDQPGQFTLPAEVRFVRVLPGSIERVWEYLTDSQKRGTWLASGPMQLRIGGKVELRFRHSELSPGEKLPPKYAHIEDGHVLEGTITELSAPRVLAFTWDDDDDPSEVKFELTPEDNQVRLVLTHRKLGSRAEMESVSGGWHTHLMILLARLENRTPPPFWATHQGLEKQYSTTLDKLLTPAG